MSLVTWLAIAGVALGVTALVGGFSLTAGFEVAFTEKLLGITPHIYVREFGVSFRGYRMVEEIVSTVDGVKATAPMTLTEAMISGPDGTTGAIVKGVVPERITHVLALEQYIDPGIIKGLSRPNADGVKGIILGGALAEKLGVEAGGVVTVVSPLVSPDTTDWQPKARAPRTENFEVRGLITAGFHEYDVRFAYMELSLAQSFFGVGDIATGIEVSVDDVFQATAVADEVRRQIGPGAYSVLDWKRQNRNLFKSLTYQRLAIIIVLSVMVILASCNLACTLIMMVLDRTKEIAIIKAMGGRDGSILRLFILQGMFIGAVGTAVGLLGGFLLCEVILAEGLPLDPAVYGIDHLPVVSDPLDYLMAAAGALAISFLATILPAWRGARQHPVDGLRAQNHA
ncbi:MAG: FtsX-like permease family protein [Bradymonadia bacterium]